MVVGLKQEVTGSDVPVVEIALDMQRIYADYDL